MSVEKVVMDQGFAPSLAGLGLTRPYERQGGRRTGLVLLAGGCLGGVLVCAVLMPLVYVTMSDLQLEVTELRNLLITRPAQTVSPGTEDRVNDTAAGGAHRERRAADTSIWDVYVRWGRENCSENAKTIYSGVVGSGWYHHHGGGSDYQCLPLEGVEWNNPVAGHQHNSYMYGAEYEVNGDGYFSTDTMGPYISNPLNYDVPCSVCLVELRSAHVMIPARLSCPTGWSKEYSGYLMSSNHAHYSNKNFICVDGAPNLRQGSSANVNGALLYLVEAQCGSLPCGPYISGYELTCVVCTL
ncbi:uncharacterized protein LOC118432693 isoform X1 [Branchiostoma floridae]|uniref:Uncharacterized protein LOC118432693 isoform X1 n=1 Tax=Branchiostoma floridae TaxID=7739 RepID=A0A9J7MGC2_BRAFL|nr:uncharacterized protein LOC118432693 isoform X1 [Branchiostoma floridae]